MKYGNCRECGQRSVIQDDGVSHHISESTGGTDHEQDAKHVAVVSVRRVITVHRLSLQFDNYRGDLNDKDDEELAQEAVNRINEELANSSVGRELGAQLIATRDEIEVVVEDEDD